MHDMSKPRLAIRASRCSRCRLFTFRPGYAAGQDVRSHGSVQSERR